MTLTPKPEGFIDPAARLSLAVADALMIPGILEDGGLYPIEKMEAHRLGALHLAISAFVFDGDRLLIQRRALTKYHCGGLWANTCCTHPHWNEAPASAARRRVREELGFEVDLTETRIVTYRAEVDNGLIEHERVHMFTGTAGAATLAIAMNPAEVCETRWVTGAELKAAIAATPEQFTPWFKIYVERFPDLRF
jgi:isopentenyl-diphosphate Delta-isomerase